MGGSVSKSERLDGGGESTATARADLWPTRRRIEDVKRWRHARTRKDSIVSTTELLGPVEDPDAATNFSEDSPNDSTPPAKESDDSIELLKERKDTKAEKDAKPVHVVAEHGSSTAAEEQREEEEEEEEDKVKQAVVAAEEEGKRREEVEKKPTSEVENKVEPEVEKKVEEEERRGDERKGKEEEEEEKEEEIRGSASFRFYFKQPESDEESVKCPGSG